jgi:excisionase family DNA binding protein
VLVPADARKGGGWQGLRWYYMRGVEPILLLQCWSVPGRRRFCMSQIAYSTADACRQLGVSRRTLSNMIRDGRLVARKLGRKTLIDGAALESCWKGLPLVEGPAPINSPRQNFLQAR